MTVAADTVRACPDCDATFSGRAAAMMLGTHRKSKHREAWEADRADRAPARPARPEVEDDAEDELPPAAAVPVEVAPSKPRLRDRLRNRRGRGRSGGPSPTSAPGERAPKRGRPRGRRVALDADVSDIWAFAGRRLEASPHFATGRMLQYQAPAAGVIIDRAVAGTLPDRVLFQPLARNRDKYEGVGFLLAGPLLTFSITLTGQQIQAAQAAGDQEAYDAAVAKLAVQREMFVWVLGMMLPRLAEGAKRAAEKKAQRDAVIAEAFPDLGAEDPVEVLASWLFQPPNFQEASQNGSSDTTTADPRGEGSFSL